MSHQAKLFGRPKRAEKSVFHRADQYDQANLEIARAVLRDPSAHPDLTVQWAEKVVFRLDPDTRKQEQS